MDKDLIFIGDVHNNIPDVLYSLKVYNIKDTMLVQVGDFGIGFPHVKWELYDQTYSGLSNELSERNSYLYVIRGNHDNPKYFDGTFEYPAIKFVKDYDILQFKNLKILCLGGAISVDRLYRTSYNLGWWSNEGFVYNLSEIENLTDIDIAVSHTAPDFASPIGFGYTVENYTRDGDFDLKRELTRERSELTAVYRRLIAKNSLRLWVYGHFHTFYMMNYDNTVFRSLAINEWFNYTRFLRTNGE